MESEKKFMKSKIVKIGTYNGFAYIIRKIDSCVPVEYKPLFLGTDYWFCGYVNIPKSHPFYQKNYDEITCEIDVHGGLTFSGELNGMSGYWIGFDCNHYDDNHFIQNETYTIGECIKLIEQLISIKKELGNEQYTNT